jgi:hypothetical protein
MPVTIQKMSKTDLEKTGKCGCSIPTKWLLSQAMSCYINGIEEMVFAVVEDKIHMIGIRDVNDEGVFKPAEVIIEEFPPWP